jgi:hypothetical protein
MKDSETSNMAISPHLYSRVLQHLNLDGHDEKAAPFECLAVDGKSGIDSECVTPSSPFKFRDNQCRFFCPPGECKLGGHLAITKLALDPRSAGEPH